MAEVLIVYDNPLEAPDRQIYRARVCARERDDSHWEGWLEFTPATEGDVLRTGRETTQPNRDDIRYWAKGLTVAYLEGALRRSWDSAHATRPVPMEPEPDVRPSFPGPAPAVARSVPAAPHTAPRPARPAGQRSDAPDLRALFLRGEEELRQKLRALSPERIAALVMEQRIELGRGAAIIGSRKSHAIDLIVESIRRDAAVHRS